VFCDNAQAHNCKKVEAYLAEHGDRIHIHYLPKRSPDTNPIERVWWHLHEEITRNHRCKDMKELLELVFAWLGSKKRHQIEGSVYPLSKAG
jgi:transposase